MHWKCRVCLYCVGPQIFILCCINSSPFVRLIVCLIMNAQHNNYFKIISFINHQVIFGVFLSC